MNFDEPKKRSLTVKGHRTSISLEAVFWNALHKQAEFENLTMPELVSRIDKIRGEVNLCSAIRCYVWQTRL